MNLSAVQTSIRRIPPESPLSFEAFLEWCEDTTRAEWVRGEVIVMSPASKRHQELCDFLTSVLRIYTETKGLGLVLSAPFLMRLGEVPSGREPDVLFLKAEHLARFTDMYLEGPADLVVEVISEESIGRDRGDKFVEYEGAGIPEYWLIDPIRHQVEFYRLDGEGRYATVQPEGGVYRSEALADFWFRVDWLWEDPLPRVLDVVRELGVLDA